MRRPLAVVRPRATAIDDSDDEPIDEGRCSSRSARARRPVHQRLASGEDDVDDDDDDPDAGATPSHPTGNVFHGSQLHDQRLADQLLFDEHVRKMRRPLAVVRPRATTIDTSDDEPTGDARGHPTGRTSSGGGVASQRMPMAAVQAPRRAAPGAAVQAHGAAASGRVAAPPVPRFRRQLDDQHLRGPAGSSPPSPDDVVDPQARSLVSHDDGIAALIADLRGRDDDGRQGAHRGARRALGREAVISRLDEAELSASPRTPTMRDPGRLDQHRGFSLEMSPYTRRAVGRIPMQRSVTERLVIDVDPALTSSPDFRVGSSGRCELDGSLDSAGVVAGCGALSSHEVSARRRDATPPRRAAPRVTPRTRTRTEILDSLMRIEMTEI